MAPARLHPRELCQCVRNVMILGSYRPALPQRDRAGELGPVEEWLQQIRGVEITADELLGRYYALAYDRSDVKLRPTRYANVRAQRSPSHSWRF
jgi:hypothetical protein